jgi:hypothetical protein
MNGAGTLKEIIHLQPLGLILRFRYQGFFNPLDTGGVFGIAGE